MKAMQNIKIILVSMGIILLLSSFAYANQKAVSLKRAMADLSLLHNQLLEKKKQAQHIKIKLENKIDQLKKEILKEKRSKNIKTESDADKNSRIHYDLMLISDLTGFVDIFSKKILFYKTGHDRLQYLYQQAEDELKIINAFNDLKIAALIAQVKSVVESYIPEAQTILISSKSLYRKSPGKIWQEINTDDP